MAANYWSSTQRLHWTFTRPRLAEIRASLEAVDEKTVQAYPLPEYRLLSIYFNSQFVRLGRRLQARQQALATAQLYIRRFYTKVPIRDTNPYLVMATCLYLAFKMEECPQHIRVVASEARTCFGVDVMPNDPAKLAECEFWLISEMNSYLIVHHPYRTLQELQSVLSITQDESNLSWQVVNDSCLTDLPLIYAPHLIALSAIFLSVVLKPTMGGGGGSGTGGGGATAGSSTPTTPTTAQSQHSRIAKLMEWYAESKVDMEAVVDCVQEIMSLYEVWDSFSMSAEKQCKEQLLRMIKQRGTT